MDYNPMRSLAALVKLDLSAWNLSSGRVAQAQRCPDRNREQEQQLPGAPMHSNHLRIHSLVLKSYYKHPTQRQTMTQVRQ